MNRYQFEIIGLRHRQEFLAILIFALVAVMVWVGVSLVSTQRQTKIAPELQDMAKPLSPTLNGDVFDQLEQKRSFSDAELRDFTIFSLVETGSRFRSNSSPIPVASSAAENQLSTAVLTSANPEAASSAATPTAGSLENPAASGSAQTTPSL